MKTGDLGKQYQDREVIFRQGEAGDWMYVVQEGKVEVYLERDGNEIPLRLCREGDFLGEMALFRGELRPYHARAVGNARLLTVDKKNFLRRIQEDPTMAFRLVEELSRRIQELNEDIAVLSRALRDCMGGQLA
jgi:CRP-like cAMP-binding protein